MKNETAANATTLWIETDDNGIRILTIDGPETRNSIGRQQYDAIGEAIISAGDDINVRAIVLQGAGGFFSSGGNVNALKESRNQSLADVSKNTDALRAMILAIRNCPTPVIAAVEGGAAGLGVSLALSCDMIVAAVSAKFTAAYVKIGLTPDGGATHFLMEALPRQLVSEICMLGKPIGANRLYQAGAINILVEDGGAKQAALELAKGCALGAGNAITVIKKEIEAASGNGLSAQIELEARNINKARFGDEAAEGLQAFLEKRKPKFVSKNL